MAAPVLWLSFLGDEASNDVRPTLRVDDPVIGEPIELSDRARAFVAALAVPPEMAEGSTWTATELSTWQSAVVVERMHYSHRRAIQDAIKDLRRQLAAHDLPLEHYLHADKTSGRYGLNNVRVDVVELLRRRDEPDRLDKALATSPSRPAGLRLTQANKHLWSAAAVGALGDVLSAADARWTPGYGLSDGDGPAPTEPLSVLPPPATEPHRPGRSRARRRRASWGFAAVVAAAVAGIVALAFTGGSGGDPSTGNGRTEVPGGPARAWSDYTLAGGKRGQPLRAGVPVRVSCRARGLVVPDGDAWWYRLPSSPWHGRYYASADAFYNNGRTRGTLHGSLLVDKKVPLCP